jgi:hypothetical protein
MDPVQVVTSISTALGESGDTVEVLFRGLFRAFPDAGSTDWPGVEQVLYTQPAVEYGKVAALLDALRALAAQAGGAEDPRTVFEDHDLRGYFAADIRAPAADQSATTPVAEGSAISRVGDAYYLGQDHQVWQAAMGDTVYYHDGTQNYDTLGRPLDAPGAASPATGEPGQGEDPGAWNGYLARNGPRWDGTEPSWAQFRDWFLYDAAANGVSESAAGFITLAERRTFWARLHREVLSRSPPSAASSGAASRACASAGSSASCSPRSPPATWPAPPTDRPTRSRHLR